MRSNSSLTTNRPVIDTKYQICNLDTTPSPPPPPTPYKGEEKEKRERNKAKNRETKDRDSGTVIFLVDNSNRFYWPKWSPYNTTITILKIVEEIIIIMDNFNTLCLGYV